VKQGRKRPWQLRPYVVAKLPHVSQSARLGGVAYDFQSDRLYVSEMYADKPNQYDVLPLIQVYEIRTAKK
jgi:hypothetical protein